MLVGNLAEGALRLLDRHALLALLAPLRHLLLLLLRVREKHARALALLAPLRHLLLVVVVGRGRHALALLAHLHERQVGILADVYHIGQNIFILINLKASQN